MEKFVYFITGSQPLYGEDILKKVDDDGKEIVSFLNAQKGIPLEIKYYGVACDSQDTLTAIEEVNYDTNCVGVIVWCHTFSPAKNWINGLKKLSKPLLHLHTQYNEKLPYESIDMDFMNLNQSAHGDREFGHITARLNTVRKVICGYYKHDSVVNEIFSYLRLMVVKDFGERLKVIRFGDNMRGVAVTDGDKVSAQIKFGFSVDYYGLGDLIKSIDLITAQEVQTKYDEYVKEYTLDTDNDLAVKEQIKYELGIKNFLDKNKSRAFTTNFQDLNGLNQLPGLAVQNLMKQGYGFGAEGDWKTSALTAMLKHGAKGLTGFTAFMEDYTYDLTENCELELGSHMLEVDPTIAQTKPKIQVHPLGIGGKNPPARLVFDGGEGCGIAVSLVDTGDNFKLIVQKLIMVKSPKETPKLPVAKVVWKILPDFKTGAKRWIEEGGAHHIVLTNQYTPQDILDLAKIYNVPCVIIG